MTQKLIYHGPQTRMVYLALADDLEDAFDKSRRTYFKLCDAESSELVFSFDAGCVVNDGDEIAIPPITFTVT